MGNLGGSWAVGGIGSHHLSRVDGSSAIIGSDASNQGSGGDEGTHFDRLVIIEDWNDLVLDGIRERGCKVEGEGLIIKERTVLLLKKSEIGEDR